MLAKFELFVRKLSSAQNFCSAAHTAQTTQVQATHNNHTTEKGQRLNVEYMRGALLTGARMLLTRALVVVLLLLLTGLSFLSDAEHTQTAGTSECLTWSVHKRITKDIQ